MYLDLDLALLVCEVPQTSIAVTKYKVGLVTFSPTQGNNTSHFPKMQLHAK